MKLCPPAMMLLGLVTLTAAAENEMERADLGLLKEQINVIGQLADRARSRHVESEDARYCFDYSRLSSDLDRLHHGIDKYLSPSRAEPTDLSNTTDDYRAANPHLGSTNDHD